MNTMIDKITFLGSFYPKEREREFKTNSTFFDIPGNILQWALLEGLTALTKLNVITAPATKRFKSFFVKESVFRVGGVMCGWSVGFCDIVGFKDILVSSKIYRRLLRDKPNIIIVYSIQLKLLRAVYKYKRTNSKTKVIVIVTDLPMYMRDKKSFIYTALKKIEDKLDCKYLLSCDGFILLSEQMRDYKPLSNVKHLIIEGIYNPIIEKEITLSEVLKSLIQSFENKKVMLYSGSLSDRYGIFDLISVFFSIKNPNYRLVLCGRGLSERSKHVINLDNRILYLGLLERKDVLFLQQNCTVLVNPRKSKEVYTQYSFPSKTMEYMVSGRPVLMSKLGSIPHDYYDYLYFFEDETFNGMKNTIVKILSKPSDELNIMGKRAQEFIIKHKNIKTQTEKIFSFIKNL